MTDSDEKKRIDEEWKLRAEEEKRKIEDAMGPPRPEPTPGAADAPGGEAEPGSASEGHPKFLNLISQLGAQAMASLGQMEDPHTGQRYLDLDLARESIDILSMLEAKTRGNLDAEEKAALDELLRSLRMAFVQISRAAQEQAMNAPPPGGPGGPGGPGPS